ncbi:eukaryotic translation initiation factor 4 gamma 1-like [Brachyhypopomus gauderio]|uniref:eukaryotic translation initiation factor 4 gamma 1-like n=2 Tax=Brachyhypopomus gauderio TaxID=698409 RepID=UPI004042D880
MKEKKRLPFPLHIGVEPKVLSDCALFPPGVPYYPTQDQYQSSGPIILSSALQQQAPPPQYALPQQRRRECQQTVVAVQTDDESTPPTATVVIPPAAASTPPPPSKVPELVVPSKLTTEPNLSQGLQLASPLSTVPVGQDSDFGASASPPPPLTDLPPADIPALEPKMGESMDAPLVSEAVPQAEKEPVEAPLEPEPPVSRSSQCQRKSPRKIITSVSFSNDIQLNKAEKAWRPSMKKVRAHKAEADEENLEVAKTLDLLRRVRSILNKLTPQMFQPLMKQLTELSMDTEERLKGVVDLVYEKAISEPKFSVTYAKLCRCLMMLKVPTSDKSGGTVNFGRLLLNCCQKEFAKDKDSNERKQKELEAASEDEERQRLIEELDAMKDEARHRSLGNIKFIGELFKVEMLSELILHDCIVKLLQKSHSEERLECLCILLSTIGKDIEKAKPKMDHYCSYISKIINARKSSLRIRCKLQDVLDLRQNNWVPRRGDQGPKTIVEIHKEANLEEQREQIKVPEQLLSKKDSSRACWSRRGPPVRRPHHPTSGRCLEFES